MKCSGWEIITCFKHWQHQLSSAFHPTTASHWAIRAITQGQSEIEKSIWRRLAGMHLQAAVMTADSFLQLLVQSQSKLFVWSCEQKSSVILKSVQLNVLSASQGTVWYTHNASCYGPLFTLFHLTKQERLLEMLWPITNMSSNQPFFHVCGSESGGCVRGECVGFKQHGHLWFLVVIFSFLNLQEIVSGTFPNCVWMFINWKVGSHIFYFTEQQQHVEKNKLY